MVKYIIFFFNLIVHMKCHVKTPSKSYTQINNKYGELLLCKTLHPRGHNYKSCPHTYKKHV